MPPLLPPSPLVRSFALKWTIRVFGRVVAGAISEERTIIIIIMNFKQSTARAATIKLKVWVPSSQLPVPSSSQFLVALLLPLLLAACKQTTQGKAMEIQLLLFFSLFPGALRVFILLFTYDNCDVYLWEKSKVGEMLAVKAQGPGQGLGFGAKNFVLGKWIVFPVFPFISPFFALILTVLLFSTAVFLQVNLRQIEKRREKTSGIYLMRGKRES